MKSKHIIEKSEEIRKSIIAELKILESTWDINTPAGCGVRQALQYLEHMDFNARPVSERCDCHCRGN